MNEIWADIKGYEGKYQVSNKGRVKSLNYGNTGTEKLMRIANGRKGYKIICLTKNNKRKSAKVHRLVAEAFIPNPYNFPTVNHKDEDKSNNCAENLEWCTFEYNIRYGTRSERTGTPVRQLDLNGAVIAEYKTASEAMRKTGADSSHIARCCRGEPHYNTAKGYKWEFVKQ